MGIKDEAFAVLHESLCHIRPDYLNHDVILCPICLREISKETILDSGIEHIIPRVATKKDKGTSLATLNQRSGITVLCREPRTIGTATCKDGCNGFKGKTYDWAVQNLLDDKDRNPNELNNRHAVAILIMAYLGAFQAYGYDYILRPELDEIRKQFDNPDVNATNWLPMAKYNLRPGETSIVTTSTGHPFIYGGMVTNNAPLHIVFRRCQAYLPGGHWDSVGVRTLKSLLPSLTP